MTTTTAAAARGQSVQPIARESVDTTVPRKPRSALRPTTTPVAPGESLSQLLTRLSQRSFPTRIPSSACDAEPWSPAARVPEVVYCDGLRHYVGPSVAGTWDAIGPCPSLQKQQTRGRVEAERMRLARPLKELRRHGGARFDGYDPNRDPSAARALAAMRCFASATPPARNVLLAGPTGLGKTRLLLASHFHRLGLGLPSVYVTAADLREWFHWVTSYDEDLAAPARAALDRLYRAEVVHLDDLAHIEGDARGRGAFAEGIKTIFDRSGAMRAVATNRTGDEAESHPDLCGTVLSRLLLDADVVEMSGIDFRQQTARIS